MGFARTSTIGLGTSFVSSRIRVPRPAARMTALVVRGGVARGARWGENLGASRAVHHDGTNRAGFEPCRACVCVNGWVGSSAKTRLKTGADLLQVNIRIVG